MPWGSRGGGTLPGPARGRVPCQVQLGEGYSGWGGTLAGGVPWPGGYPGRGGTPPGGVPGQGGYPGWRGTLAREGTLAGGVPWPGGYPGQGGTQLGQHREYLLHSGRYVSCVHAGGLSCFNLNCVLEISFGFQMQLEKANSNNMQNGKIP